MWNLKYNTTEHIYRNRLTDRDNRFMVRGEGTWGRKDWEFETGRYKLSYIRDG